MKSILLFITACLFGPFFSKAQIEIDYVPKLLIKELSGAKGQIHHKLIEIILPDELASQIYIGKYFRVENSSHDISTKYVYIGRVNSCRSGGCSGGPIISNGQISEYFDYFILFNNDCAVSRVKVFNYQATHGQEITATGWLKQFIGYRGVSELNAGRNIDAISGATISVEGIVADIQNKTRLLHLFLQKNSDQLNLESLEKASVLDHNPPE